MREKLLIGFLLILCLNFLACKDCIDCAAYKHIYKGNKLDSTLSYGLASYCNDDANSIRNIDSVKRFYPDSKDSSNMYDLMYKCYK